MPAPILDPVPHLHAAVQRVRAAAAEFPPGHRDAAVVAAARVLLEGVPGVKYRVWPVSEPLYRTLDAQARDLLETAEQVMMIRDHGDAEVLRVLDKLVRELGYIRTDAGIEVPF